MAINPSSKYPSGTEVVANDYPHGRAKNESAPGAFDGLPFEKDWVNDLLGYIQAALTQANITPSNSPDTAQASQILDAVVKLAGVSKFPSKAYRTRSTVAGTWDLRDDSGNNPINGDDVTVNSGELRLTPTTGNEYTKAESLTAVADKVLAKYGAILGVQTGNVYSSVAMASAFGYRAILSYNAGTWSYVSSSNAGFNSAADQGHADPTVTTIDSGAGVTVDFSGASVRPSTTWSAQLCTDTGANQEIGGVSALIEPFESDYNKARVRFLAEGAISGRISSQALVSGSDRGILSVSYDAVNFVLTVTHKKRSGPVTLQAETNVGNRLVPTVLSDTSFEVRYYDSGSGSPINIAVPFGFTRNAGPFDYVAPANGTTLLITNGTGAKVQDFDNITATIGVQGSGTYDL